MGNDAVDGGWGLERPGGRRLTMGRRRKGGSLGGRVLLDFRDQFVFEKLRNLLYTRMIFTLLSKFHKNLH